MARLGGFVLGSMMTFWEGDKWTWINLDRLEQVQYQQVPKLDAGPTLQFAGVKRITFAHRLVLRFAGQTESPLDDQAKIDELASKLGIELPDLPPPRLEPTEGFQSP